jgi:oligosaccharyl transferase (archaeosortase A-associated)
MVDSQTKRSWSKSHLITGILLAVFFGVALYLRVALPYDKVFVGDWIKFTGVDAYYFMRIADNLVHNFPHIMSFDPYLLYPSGQTISGPTFWPFLISSFTWLFSLGSPSQHTVDVVGVYFPAVIGALTTIPVYFIGKTLFNRWAGVIAAGLVGIFPGEFLGRSILGFTDYHVAEVFFTTIAMLFLILAVKAGRDSQLTIAKLRHWNSATITRPLVYSILAGIFLGIYFLTWAGALLFVFIIFSYFVIQFIIDHLKGRSTEYLCFVSTIVFIIALLMFLPSSPTRIVLASFVIAIVIPVIMTALSYFMSKRNMKPIIYPAVIVGLGLVSLAIIRIANPSLLHSMIGRLYIFKWPIGTTVLEMQPLLLPSGSFSWSLAWGNFTTGFFLSFISLGILIYLVTKRGETEKTAFVVWSLIILAATLAMRRFAYYLVINIALLTGYLSWLFLDISGFNKLTNKPVDRHEESSKKAKLRKREGSISGVNALTMSLATLIVFFVVFFPNIGNAINTAKQVSFAPSNAWYESLTWLQNNTPEPFDNPDYYYELYEKPRMGERYQYPETAYGVTAWWDYGYWITRIGHRMPTSSPGSGNKGEASFFTAQDETSADEALEKLGSKYIIIDNSITTVVGGKFHALATLSGNSPDDYYSVYYQEKDNRLQPILLFYPEYYRSLVIRLYNFDGDQVSPTNINVIVYQEKVAPDGYAYRQITDVQTFHSYEIAENYVTSQKSGNYRIVSADPFSSPTPLPELEHYRLIYSSNGTITDTITGKVSPEEKIFEYLK